MYYKILWDYMYIDWLECMKFYSEMLLGNDILDYFINC